MPNKLTKEFSASQVVDGTFAGGLHSAITLFELAVRATGGKITQWLALHPITRMEHRVAVVQVLGLRMAGVLHTSPKVRDGGLPCSADLSSLLVLSKLLIFTGAF